jgi:DHA2 family multidrug resistance protein
MSEAYPAPATRRFITASVMAATLMNTLDTTIANVALPHVQGSVSASADEITWVLTSYIVSAAIFMPLTGWLAGRFGRKQLMLWSIVGFTIASALCGASNTLVEIVGARILQGVFGAALVPMSQAVLLDINPPDKHAGAMSIWSMGAVLGPIIGPTLGGWLTDDFNWRWVFFINLPFGMLAFAGLTLFLGESRAKEPVKLDLFGFGLLALALGSLQLMLDRGQTQDWFSATEIRIEAGCALLFGYMVLAHTLTTRRPFIDPALFADRNFTLSILFGFFMAVVLYGLLALVPPLMESLLGYPVILTGVITAPRGVGSLCAMIVTARLMKWFDPRIFIAMGFASTAISTYGMTHFSLGMGTTPLLVTGIVQGFGSGFIFVPLSTLAFGTLDKRFRNEGAVMFTLTRNVGSAIGIATLQAITVRNTAIVHARLVEGIRPDNPVLARAAPDFDFTVPAAVARMNALVTRQAMMVSYIDTFRLLFILSLVMIPLVPLLRTKRRAPDDAMQRPME